MKLVKYEAARHALQLAKSVDEVKDIRDKAEAIRAYAKQAKDFEMANWAAEIRIRAERKLGEMIPSQFPQGGDRKSNGHDDSLKLSDIGVGHKMSQRAQGSFPDNRNQNSWQENRFRSINNINSSMGPGRYCFCCEW